MFKKVIKDTIPVMTGYVVLGMGFGLLMMSGGYGIGLSFAMSLFIYAGSMQYLGIGFLSGGVSLITVAITTLMVNCRHLFYGISMVDRYKGMGPAKPYAIFALTDETYSLVCNDNKDMTEKERHRYYLMVSAMDQLYWVTGTVLGSLIGSVVHFNTEGIDFSLTALFIVVCTDQWIKEKNHLPAIIGFVASIVSLIFVGENSFLIPSMVIIAVLLITSKKYMQDIGVNSEDSEVAHE